MYSSPLYDIVTKDLPRKAFHRGLCPELQKVPPHPPWRFNKETIENYDEELTNQK